MRTITFLVQNVTFIIDYRWTFKIDYRKKHSIANEFSQQQMDAFWPVERLPYLRHSIDADFELFYEMRIQ